MIHQHYQLEKIYKNQKKIQNQKPTYQNSPSNFIQKFDQIVNYSS